METEREDLFQIATLVVVVLTALVCMCYLLIFLNPQIALNPLKPPLPTRTLVAGLPPTWTPTATNTPTPTFTPSATPTITETPLPTGTPTRTRTSTRRPPTRTPIPATPVSSGYPYLTVKQGCHHSGGTFIEGTVWAHSGGSPLAGARVVMGSGPGPGTGDTYSVTSGSQGRSDGYYVHVIRGDGPAVGNYWVWIADGSGTPLSDPHAGQVTINGIKNPDDPAACWRAVVDFVRR